MTSCAVHPARPAVDACPVCTRPRCGPDAEAAPEGGCAACAGAAGAPTVRAASRREVVVRAVLASYAASLLLSPVVSQYVGAGLLALVLPFVLGVLAGEAGQRAASTVRPDAALRAAFALLAVAGTAVGLLLEGSAGLASLQVLPAYAAAAAGAVLWTAPPRVRAAAGG